MIYGAHPQSILDNPAVEVIKHIPTVWDETTVLPPSEIGVLAVFARRRGDDWWVGILNADAEKNVRVPLSFLAAGNYRATLVRDQKEKSDAVKMERVSVTRRTQLTVDLRAGGGFVGWFTR
jgi:alpha-glucosidase